ncbi:TolC family outer membrane protein [Magnetospirillum sp. SS-4]|uniref:TolC family outer membrane protein n=1 Tax=Magnetospirillum sp. SS-4 TaxID=2681465 RepID=UPI0015731A91|nr:TolC family outer membrane protein [Magnetospirillum sp. SS-4]
MAGTIFGTPWPEIGSWGQAWDEAEEDVLPPADTPSSITAFPEINRGQVKTLPNPDFGAQECFAFPSGTRDTLSHVLAAAYSESPTLKAQRATLRALDERAVQAKSGERPTVTGTGKVGRGVFTDTSSREYDQMRNTAQYGVVISQPLYDGGRTGAAIKEADANIMAGRALLQKMEQDVLMQAVGAYLDVMRTEGVLRLNDRNVAALQAELEDAQRRNTVHETSQTDIAQVQARLSSAEAARAQAVGAVGAAKANFTNVVGYPPGALEPVPAPSSLPASLEEAIKLARTSNPLITSARQKAASVQYGIDVVESELMPHVSLDAEYDRQLGYSSAGSEQVASALLLKLRVPLYSSGSTEARLRAQKHLAGDASLQAAQSRRDVDEQTITAWNDLLRFRAEKVAKTAQIKSAEIALKGSRLEEAQGQRTKLDVLNAQLELFYAQTAACSSLFQERAAAYRLLVAVGGMTVDGLGLPVQPYDPSVNYEKTKGRWFGVDVMEEQS